MTSRSKALAIYLGLYAVIFILSFKFWSPSQWMVERITISVAGWIFVIYVTYLKMRPEMRTRHDSDLLKQEIHRQHEDQRDNKLHEGPRNVEWEPPYST